jgi:RNA polymerase subunit RPABC4/transcription elongation factor Spt4
VIRTLIIALAALAIVFWIGFAYWVNKDARQRIRSVLGIGVATLLGLVPFVGPLVYLLARPAQTHADVRSQKAELEALAGLVARARPTCPECTAPVEPDYVVCPVCTTRLHEQCVHCDALLEPLWQTCPYCATPVEPYLDAALTREAGARSAIGLGLVAESVEA